MTSPKERLVFRVIAKGFIEGLRFLLIPLIHDLTRGSTVGILSEAGGYCEGARIVAECAQSYSPLLSLFQPPAAGKAVFAVGFRSEEYLVAVVELDDAAGARGYGADAVSVDVGDGVRA